MSIDCDESLVSARDLTVKLLDPADAEFQTIVEADLDVFGGEVTGLVGASGSGKSTLALALSGLLSSSARISADALRVCGHELFWQQSDPPTTGRQLAEKIRPLRFGDIMYISQNARSTLVPNRSIRWHLELATRSSSPKRRTVSDAEMRDESATLLTRYFRGNRTKAQQTLSKIPSQLSTGECQRVLFAMAMRRRPSLLIADEPLASLDPTTSQTLVGEIRDFVDSGAGLILVSHQWDLFDALRDRGSAYVVDRGKMVDRLPLGVLLRGGPRALSTAKLFHYCDHRFASPSGVEADQPMSDCVVEAHRIAVKLNDRWLFTDQSIRVPEGSCCGIYGESGGGKTTLARVLAGLKRTDKGDVIRFDQKGLSGDLTLRQCRKLWRRVQLVYQDTDVIFDSNETIAEGLMRSFQSSSRLSKSEAWRLAVDQFVALGLDVKLLHSPPVRLSGGERKRAAIARALAILLGTSDATHSRLLILDEPTVGLDTFHQGVLAEYLRTIQTKINLAIVVMSHDHGFIDRFCDQRISWPISNSDVDVRHNP